jgi:hypothetical protein
MQAAELLGSIDTIQYDMLYSDDCIYIHDKIHDEYTRAFTDGEEITLVSLESDDRIYSLWDATQLIALGSKIDLIKLQRQFSNTIISGDEDIERYFSSRTAKISHMSESFQKTFSDTHHRMSVFNSDNKCIGTYSESEAYQVLFSNSNCYAVNEYLYKSTK